MACLLVIQNDIEAVCLNSQLQALQILTNDDKVENWSLSSFLLAVPKPHIKQTDSLEQL